MKSIVDLREKINAYRYGKTKGKLTDYAKLTGLDIPDMDGSKVAELCKDKNFSELRKYLESDLNTTEHLLKRAHETNILHINRW